MAIAMATKPSLLFVILALTIIGCGPEPLTDCDKGLCGHKWALEVDSAVASGEARVQAQPNDANALLTLAEAYIQKASFVKNQTDSRADFWLSSNLKKIDHLLDESINLCNKALQQKQDIARAYQLKGKSFRLKVGLNREDTGNWLRVCDQSVSNLEKAVSLAPDAAEMWYELGLACSNDQSRWDKAKSCFEMALKLDPNHAGAKALLSTPSWPYFAGVIGTYNVEELHGMPLRGHRYDRDNFLETIRLVPDPAKAPFVIGISFLVIDPDEAWARYYKELVQNKHHHLKDHFDLALAGRHEDWALKHFKTWAQANNGLGSGVSWLSLWDFPGLDGKMSRVYPMSPWSWIYRGRVAADRDSALGYFRKAIALDSNLTIGYYLLAATYLEKGDLVNAEGWFKAFRRAPADEFLTLNAHLLNAFVQARTGEMSKATQECELALRLDSTYARHALSRGIFGRRYGEHDGSRDLWFLLNDPIGPQALKTRSERKVASLLNLSSGWGYWRREAWGEKNNKFFRSAVELDPDNVDAYVALARMYNYQNEYDHGIELVQKAIRLHPENAEAHLMLGVFYVNKNLLEKGRQEMELAYKLGNLEAKITLYEMEKAVAQKDK
jgi:tetratricopeptide (TPR) repeat protein